MKKLLEIYKNKIITNIKEFSDDYYYFYNYDELFGISKSISKTEYELLKLSYQEKVIYNKDSKLQKLYEFLYDNNSLLPKKTKLIMYPFQKEIDHIVTEMLESIFDITILDYKDIKLGFIKNLFDVDICEILDSLTTDINTDIYVHDAGYIESLTGKELITYIEGYRTSNKVIKNNSQVVDLIYDPNINNYSEFINICVKKLIYPIKEYIDLVNSLFKNDLNVLKTSKELYINRNSILMKIEQIESKIGLNIQKFQNASAIKFLLAIARL